MLFSAEQAFVGRDEKRAPLKMPARQASFMCTHLILIPNYYGQFALFMGQESSDMFSDIPLIQMLSIVPSVSELMRHDYITLVIVCFLFC